MSRDKRIVFAMVVSWVSQGMSAFASLLLVPILYRYMTREALGVWYLISSGQLFVGLVGFGFAPVLTRHIALLAKGSHIDDSTVLAPAEREELNDLFHTGRLALRWMAAVTMIVALIIGYFLIRHIPLEHMAYSTVFWAWVIMCLGWSAGVWMSYLDCWLAGIGHVGADTTITLCVTLGSTIASMVAVIVWHGSILSLAWIALGAVIVQRFALVAYLHRRNIWRGNITGRWSTELARRLVKPSTQFWITAVGAFLIYKTDQYFIAVYLGTSHVALYQSTYNIIHSLALAAGAATSSIVVFVSQFWIEGKRDSVHRLLIRGCRIGFVILMSGELFLITTGKPFFLVFFKGGFIGYPVMLVLMLTLALDTQHGLLTYISRATDDEVYAIPAMAGGVLNLIFTWILIRKLGLIGVVIGTLLAQVLTNNWYGVYRPLTRLSFPFKRYLGLVIAPVLLFTVLSACVVLAFKWVAMRIWGPGIAVSLVSGTLATSITGAAGLLAAYHGLSRTPFARLFSSWSVYAVPTRPDR